MDPNPVEVPFPYEQGIDKFQESQYVIVYKSLSKMGLFLGQPIKLFPSDWLI